MIRSSALYISLIVSLLILLVCGAMLMVGYTYKMQERKQERRIQLARNIASGTQLVLLSSFRSDTSFRLSLFNEAKQSPGLADSVLLEKRTWGLYETALVETWAGRDTLSKAFLIGYAPEDTLKVFYLADEDRPVSISGKSKISGMAFLPKSGIRAAYVESSGYADKTLVYGKTVDSDRFIPEPDGKAWEKLADWIFGLRSRHTVTSGPADSVSNSFLNQVQVIRLDAHAQIPAGTVVSGNVVFLADSSITLSGDARLKNVILIAPFIRIDDRFDGSVQALATDSISTGNQVHLRYPSAMMILNLDTISFQPRISVGEQSLLEGQLIAYEKERSLLMPIIEIGKGSVVKGEIWSKGYVALSKSARVEGSVSAVRLMAKVGGA